MVMFSAISLVFCPPRPVLHRRCQSSSLCWTKYKTPPPPMASPRRPEPGSTPARDPRRCPHAARCTVLSVHCMPGTAQIVHQRVHLPRSSFGIKTKQYLFIVKITRLVLSLLSRRFSLTAQHKEITGKMSMFSTQNVSKSTTHLKEIVTMATVPVTGSR